jgi:hypothetical protein
VRPRGQQSAPRETAATSLGLDENHGTRPSGAIRYALISGRLMHARPCALADSSPLRATRPQARWRARGVSELVVDLLREITLPTQLFDQVELRLVPVDGLFLFLEDTFQQLARSVVVFRHHESNGLV